MESDITAYDDPVTLAGLIFETAAGLKRAAGAPLERDYDLPQQSLEVLVRLARTPGGRLRMVDLAAQTGLTPSGLTRAIDRLVDSGLVSRQTCLEDRRGAFAALTGEGNDRMGSALACHSRQLHAILSEVLTASEAAELAALLRRLRDHLHPNAARVTRD